MTAEGRFYLTHAEVSLNQLSLTINGTPVPDPAVYQDALMEYVWGYLNDSDSLPNLPEIGAMINQAVLAPGTVIKCEFPEAKHAETVMWRSIVVAVAGTLVAIGGAAWLIAAMPRTTSSRDKGMSS